MEGLRIVPYALSFITFSYRQSKGFSAAILHIVPSMRLVENFFGSLLKMTLLVLKSCDLCFNNDILIFNTS